MENIFSGLQIENMYTCKTYIFGNRLFNVCKCQNVYILSVGVLKGLRQELSAEYDKVIGTGTTRTYAELLQWTSSWSP